MPAGNNLTDEQRAKIREECLLRDEIRRELEDAHPRPGGALSFLNSRFGLAITTGLFAALIGPLVIRVWAKADLQREQTRAFRDKKIQLLSTFIQDKERYISLRLSIHKQRDWLLANRDKENATNDVGRRLADAESDYVDLYKRFLECRSVQADLREVKAYFGDDVDRAADLYLTSVEHTFDAKSFKELLERNDGSDKLGNKLVDLMSEEVKP